LFLLLFLFFVFCFLFFVFCVIGVTQILPKTKSA
jgi:hypothetical protein